MLNFLAHFLAQLLAHLKNKVERSEIEQSLEWKWVFPPSLTFLASVFWTFLPYFSDPAFPGILREEFRSPYLIKKLTRRGIEPGPPG